MGTEEAALSAVITKNIEQALKDKELSKNELVSRTSIAKSTFYRNMKRPEDFTFREAGEIAKALDIKIVDIILERGTGDRAEALRP